MYLYTHFSSLQGMHIFMFLAHTWCRSKIQIWFYVCDTVKMILRGASAQRHSLFPELLLKFFFFFFVSFLFLRWNNCICVCDRCYIVFYILSSKWNLEIFFLNSSKPKKLFFLFSFRTVIFFYRWTWVYLLL